MKVEISNGELIDKLSILHIKMNNIKDSAKLKNIKSEYECLKGVASNLLTSNEVSKLYKKLIDINSQLWLIEDQIREKERLRVFDSEFIEISRAVYFTNDLRSGIKFEINKETNSIFFEEKSYKPY